jgi:hypothetical protein
MLSGINAPVCGYSHDLQLQKQLHEGASTVTYSRELVYGGIKIKFRLLSAVEGRLCLVALLAVKVEHAEHLFDGIDFVAGYDIVGLAECSHDRKHRIEQLRLHNAQAAKKRLTQQEAGAIADQASDN